MIALINLQKNKVQCEATGGILTAFVMAYKESCKTVQMEPFAQLVFHLRRFSCVGRKPILCNTFELRKKH